MLVLIRSILVCLLTLELVNEPIVLQGVIVQFRKIDRLSFISNFIQNFLSLGSLVLLIFGVALLEDFIERLFPRLCLELLLRKLELLLLLLLTLAGNFHPFLDLLPPREGRCCSGFLFSLRCLDFYLVLLVFLLFRFLSLDR